MRATSCAQGSLRALADHHGARGDGGCSRKGGRHDGCARGVAGRREGTGGLGLRGCNRNGLGRLCALGLGVLLGLRGLGLVGLGPLRLGYLGRCDGRALGDRFDIEGVDRGVARADGLACLVDAVTELAIVNDLAAFRRQDGGAFDSRL